LLAALHKFREASLEIARKEVKDGMSRTQKPLGPDKSASRYSLPGDHREAAPVGSSRASSNNAMQRASSLRAVSCRTTTSRESSCSITQRHRLGAPALWGTIRAW
jgi:hypothetical protein